MTTKRVFYTSLKALGANQSRKYLISGTHHRQRSRIKVGSVYSDAFGHIK